MHILRYMWFDVVLCGCRMINKILSSVIKLPFLVFILIQSCFLYCLKYLIVRILFRIKLLNLISYLPVLLSMSLLAILRLWKGISIMIWCLKRILSLLMFLFELVPYFTSSSSLTNCFLLFLYLRMCFLLRLR